MSPVTLPIPGIYLARVAACDADTDERGLWIDLRLCEDRTGRFLCFDVVRLTPRAKNIALTKLVQLGVPLGGSKKLRLDTDTLVGRRVWIALHHEEFDGVMRAKPDIARLRCGYLREEDAPGEACESCRGRSWWRRRHSGLWICSGCCPTRAPAHEIDEVRCE
jgi:hypothetical protein